MTLTKPAGLILLLGLYTILVWAYSAAIPFSKGPDEYINYQYILFIARYHRLPTTLPEKQEAGVKADWQPLYHLLAGLVAVPIDLTPPPELKVTWQPPTRQLIDLVLPRATLVRTEDERPPYRGVYAVWQTGRWVSMALGAGTLIVTYFIALGLWPGQPALAVGATALLVFIPRFLFTHAVLSDDTLLGFCLALYLLCLTRLAYLRFTIYDWDHNSPFIIHHSQFIILLGGMGLTGGLAILTKYTAIPVVAGAIISLMLIARRQKWSGRRIIVALLSFSLPLVLTIGVWVGWVEWHFNQIDQLGPVMGLIKPLLPGSGVDDNPTTARLTAFFSGQSLADLGEAAGAGGTYLDWAWHSFATYWSVSVFGAEPGWPDTLVMVALALFSLAALIGFGRLYRREPAANRLIWQLFGLQFLLFVPLPLLRFSLSRRLNDAAQGRHLLFPAGPAVALLLMAGWLEWFPSRWRSRVALLTGVTMLAWSGVHLLYLWTAYPPPLPLRTTPGPQTQIEHSTQINFDGILELAGYQTQPSADRSTLQIDLLWRCLARAQEDYLTEITLVDAAGQPYLRWLSHPAAGRLPTRAFQPGDWVRDSLTLPLAGLPAGDYTAQLRLMGWDEPLSTNQGESVPLTFLPLTPPPAPTPPNLILHPSSLIPSYYRYRSTIPVTLAQPAAVSLVDPSGRLYLPLSESGPLRLFMVGHDWPVGEYWLQVDGQDVGLHLQVDNFERQFTPPAMTYPAQVNFGNQIELLGYDLPQRQANAGQGFPLGLYWRGLAQLREDYTIFVQLLDANQQRRGGYDRLPRETYNTYLWVPGEVVDDGFAVPVNPDAPDGVYTIRVGWYRRVNGQAEPLPIWQNDQPGAETSIVIGPVKVGGPPPGVTVEQISPQTEISVVLGEQIKLLGYEMKNCQLAIINCQLLIFLYWQAFAPPTADYTVFVHLRDAAGQTVAQADGPPAAGRYPTSLWATGEIVPAEFSLTLPSDLPPGNYQLVVGLYDPLTGTRLSVPDTPDNSVILTELELK